MRINDNDINPVTTIESIESDIPKLNYKTRVRIENVYELKKWLQRKQYDDNALLIAIGNQFDTNTTSSVGFVQLGINKHSTEWDVIDRLVIHKTNGKQEKLDENMRITEATVESGINNTRHVEHLLPDEFKHAHNISWGIYDLDHIYELFTDMLKEQLTSEEIQVNMINDSFPLKIVYSISEHEPNIYTTIAPIKHPYEQ